MVHDITKRFGRYKIAVFLSSLSVVLGIFREFLIVGLLGFTSRNDDLQLYLSIFFTIGLSFDAMRLACLNLYSFLSLPQILFSASLIGLPLSFIIGFVMSYSTGEFNNGLLFIIIFGSYLNLMAALLITYKQRNNVFLRAQIINVLPNFILCPGIAICYWLPDNNVLITIVSLISVIPLIQCVFLLMLPNRTSFIIQTNNISFFASMVIFSRHLAAMLGEQLFQIIIRAAFYNYGTGYLSVFAISFRIYSALRFILVDSFIGAKLANWNKDFLHGDYYLTILINAIYTGVFFAFIALLISLQSSEKFIYFSIQLILILMFGFYFSTLVRVLYFKINQHEVNSQLVWRFAIFELICALLGYVLITQLDYPILSLLWLGYIAKPFAQLLLLRKRFHGVVVS